ncbi:MAG: 1,4-dihydroxy-2-naphthoate octaprenyltransferase [Hyphomicrobiaceae bacterium]|jgi:1,4-dihydroxy-2-naphthoate octaprenyltransferase
MSANPQRSVVTNWSEILRTQNLAGHGPIDLVSRWLLITRASVFTMTITSGLIGGLLAVGTPGADWGLFSLALLGLVIAHAANNMINDYFDLEGGVDTDGYARTLYAPHPILSNLISKQGLLAAIAISNLVDLAILAVIASVRGWGVVGFALAGLFISVFYVAPPLKLKHRGLGEPGVAIVWGPLMIGGTYLVTTGLIPAWVLLASLPYALLVTTVLIGKHVDKHDSDKAKGIHTLPVLMGTDLSLTVNCWLMGLFFVTTVVMALAGVVSIWCLVVLLALPRLRETIAIYRKPPPESAPEGYPIWPLWYVVWAFRLNRLAGGLFIAGLVLGALVPVDLY